MRPISFKRHRFPADVIRCAVWLYFGFTLSFRDVEELLAQRGIEVSYETIRCWTIKFGPQIAENLRRKRPAPSPRWHLDEMVCKVGGKRMYFWRAVDDEGEVLDLLMQRHRDTWLALKLMKELLMNQPVTPEAITTDGLGSYAMPLKILRLDHLHRPGRLRENNRAENSHLRPSTTRSTPSLTSSDVRPSGASAGRLMLFGRRLQPPPDLARGGGFRKSQRLT
jgi:transposase-like protein